MTQTCGTTYPPLDLPSIAISSCPPLSGRPSVEHVRGSGDPRTSGTLLRAERPALRRSAGYKRRSQLGNTPYEPAPFVAEGTLWIRIHLCHRCRRDIVSAPYVAQGIGYRMGCGKCSAAGFPLALRAECRCVLETVCAQGRSPLLDTAGRRCAGSLRARGHPG